MIIAQFLEGQLVSIEASLSHAKELTPEIAKVSQ